METLILAAEHSSSSDGFRSRAFRQINCRTFHSGVGLLPRPKRTTTKGPPPQPHSPPPVTSPIPTSRGSQRRSLSYSELWAGPTYSNSPPPASLPIPNFSLRRSRTVSLSFPAPDIPEVAKSAPVSPTSSPDNPFHSTVSATVTLRRMLNLETADDE